FMKKGMGLFFTGDFDGPIQATSWRDRFRSQTDPETLERSEIGLVVATLYAHPLMVWSLKDSIRAQIAQAQAFVAQHPNWMIASNSQEARRALEGGKRVIVFALEGASGILETEEDLHEFVDEKKIKIVTPLHLTDDHYGGVALLHGFLGLSSPFAWFRSMFVRPDVEGVYVNSHGLTDEGRTFARALIRHRAWIDLSHASDKSQIELSEMMTKAGQPLLYTHTVLRKYHKAERGISEAQLHLVAKTDGLIGLMPSEQMLEGTPGDLCQAGAAKLATQYKEVSEILPPDSIALGSDYNGGLPRLAPWALQCKPESPVERDGLTTIAQVPYLWKSLMRLGASVPHPLSKTIDHFLEAWRRVETNN
ncbi:MAG: membrane dipeptidase, partial [Bdellovibrionota bacterium]